MKYMKFESSDGTRLQSYYWDDVKMPKGVVQIVHGMAEHARRYDDFARYLNAHGFIVFADDHRAHGNTEKKADIGYHAGDIFQDTVRDEIEITRYLSEKYGLPVVYFGHSYGSFLGQRYLQCENLSKGTILSGSARQPDIVNFAGAALAGAAAKISGERKKGKFMNMVSFGSFNRPFRREGHNFAWLSRDVEQVKKYCYDEQCGYVMSNNFFRSMMRGLKSVYKKENLAGIDKSKPIFIFSGQKDPVGGRNAVNARKLAKMYESLGVEKVSIKVYPGARHEILNETNNREVYADVLAAAEAIIAD